MKLRYIIVLILALCILTGCGKTEPDKDEAGEPEISETEEPATEADETKEDDKETEKENDQPEGTPDEKTENDDEDIEPYNDDDPDMITGGRGMWKYRLTKDDDGNLIYTFDGLVIMLPASWADKYTIAFLDTGEYFTFYHTASLLRWQSDYGFASGRLINIGYSPDDSYTELPSYEYIGPGPDGGAFFIEFPTDVQGFYEDEEIMKEYGELAEGYDFIVENSYSTIEE